MLSLFFCAINDPTIEAGSNANKKPPVGPVRAAIPPPVVKIGKPMAPRRRYNATDIVAFFTGSKSANRKQKRVWSVIGTAPIGIFMKAPAAIKAVNNGVSIVQLEKERFDLFISVNL